MFVLEAGVGMVDGRRLEWRMLEWWMVEWWMLEWWMVDGEWWSSGMVGMELNGGNEEVA